MSNESVATRDRGQQLNRAKVPELILQDFNHGFSGGLGPVREQEPNIVVATAGSRNAVNEVLCNVRAVDKDARFTRDCYCSHCRLFCFSCFEGAAFSLYAQGCVRLRRQDIECPFSYQLLEEIPAEVELGFDERLIH